MLKTLLIYLFIQTVFSQTSIKPGMGYSNDINDVGKAICFNAEFTKGGQTSSINFESSVDYESLLNSFELNASMKVGIGIFSSSADAEFFHSIKEDSYTLSVHYYQIIKHKVSLTYSYDPETILTDTGKGIYKDGKNAFFRLFCGDSLIENYDEGAALVYSLVVQFEKIEDKQSFKSKISASFGSFVDASVSISKIAEQTKITGRIIIKAFQMGGDPSKLGQILSGSVVQCNITNVDACVKTAENMLKYSSENFPSQFTKDPQGIWEGSLVNIGTPTVGFQVSDFGMILAPSYLNPSNLALRKEIVDLYKKNKYYYDLVNYLSGMYDFYKIVKNNLINNDLVLRKGEDMFKFPNRIENIYSDIKTVNKLDYEEEALAAGDQKSVKYHFFFEFDMFGTYLHTKFDFDPNTKTITIIETNEMNSINFVRQGLFNWNQGDFYCEMSYDESKIGTGSYQETGIRTCDNGDGTWWKGPAEGYKTVNNLIEKYIPEQSHRNEVLKIKENIKFLGN